MVLRVFIIFFLGVIWTNAQANDSIFFTDIYQTNLYKGTENKLVFNHNLFMILDNDESIFVDSLIQNFLTSLDINANACVRANDYQRCYTFNTTNTDYLAWSRLWHNSYETVLNQYLNSLISDFLHNDSILTAHNTALKKTLYLYAIKHNSSLASFGKTRLNISVNKVNIDNFLLHHILPNQIWNRTITHSILSTYNESYYARDVTDSMYLYLGPNSKSRLHDCISLEIFNALANQTCYYLNNYSIFTVPGTFYIDSSLVFRELPNAIKRIKTNANSPDFAFYNLEDLNSLDRVTREYSYETFKDFIQIFIENNHYTKVFPSGATDATFSYAAVIDSLSFKKNIARLHSNRDSVQLNEIAAFLANNDFKEFRIYGNASQSEYIKIEPSNYKNLVKKYNTYQPMKISKKVDLSLYRALVIFDYLYAKGISPYKMSCIGKLHKDDKRHTYVFFDIKK